MGEAAGSAGAPGTVKRKRKQVVQEIVTRSDAREHFLNAMRGFGFILRACGAGARCRRRGQPRRWAAIFRRPWRGNSRIASRTFQDLRQAAENFAEERVWNVDAGIHFADAARQHPAQVAAT